MRFLRNLNRALRGCGFGLGFFFWGGICLRPQEDSYSLSFKCLRRLEGTHKGSEVL